MNVKKNKKLIISTFQTLMIISKMLKMESALTSDDGKVNGGLVVSVSTLCIVLVQQVLAIFNIDIPVHSEQVMRLVNTILTIGGLLGLVYDFDNNRGNK